MISGCCLTISPSTKNVTCMLRALRMSSNVRRELGARAVVEGHGDVRPVDVAVAPHVLRLRVRSGDRGGGFGGRGGRRCRGCLLAEAKGSASARAKAGSSQRREAAVMGNLCPLLTEQRRKASGSPASREQGGARAWQPTHRTSSTSGRTAATQTNVNEILARTTADSTKNRLLRTGCRENRTKLLPARHRKKARASAPPRQ